MVLWELCFQKKTKPEFFTLTLASYTDILRGASRIPAPRMIAWRIRKNICVGGFFNLPLQIPLQGAKKVSLAAGKQELACSLRVFSTNPKQIFN